MGHCVWLWQAKRKPAREVFGIGVERVERHWCAMLTTHTPPPPPPPTVPIRFTHIHTDRHTCLSLSLINAAQASATLAVKTIFRLAFQAFYGFISTKISPLNTQIVACQRRACFIQRPEQNRTDYRIAKHNQATSWLPCPVFNSLPYVPLIRWPKQNNQSK